MTNKVVKIKPYNNNGVIAPHFYGWGMGKTRDFHINFKGVKLIKIQNKERLYFEGPKVKTGTEQLCCPQEFTFKLYFKIFALHQQYKLKL